MKNNSIKKEVEYYAEIAEHLVVFFQSNIDKKFEIKVVVGEISSGLRTLIANDYNAGKLLREYSNSVHKLHLDIAIVIENKKNEKFEIVIFEIKRTKKMGLGELSQLIGYCLVSKASFGVLMNVDNSVSQELSLILDADKDLTLITRLVDDEVITHKFGVMVWNSTTQNVEYTESGSIQTLPELAEYLEEKME